MDEEHIMMVMGDSGLRGEVAALLKEKGYVVSEAGDANQCAALSKEVTPDIILSDVMIIDANCGEAIGELQANNDWAKNIPVLLLIDQDTQEADIETARKMMPEAEFMKSNWQPNHLLAKVEELLKAKRLHL